MPKLVEGLRLLSINAGLVSARAGDYGRSVRVLTNFATESVTRLQQALPRMLMLKRDTYEISGGIMRAINDIDKIEAAGTLILRGQGGQSAALTAMGRAWRVRIRAIGDAANGLRRTNDQFAAMVKLAREVMLQTELIAANIAIEATDAGPWEVELTTIADTIRAQMEDLRRMVDEAGRNLRNATETIVALASLGSRGQ
ncbi:hypothetical protein CU669_07915 [Paramagnetospirillum kuznetsovii]|uniref:Chemotaxis protein n=1 Tax=Paramagnetospirillum kuznetsovii TaxID=2053833 RepID=A0A364NZT3_9PROT|nr:hypothetical protein CU669_07915 [Paramagnetospirillum kuznetsovii]